tara:strand:- start:24387 stop:24728 length:342 start_codon:yes stop_codon:yes gene_type:complete
MTITNPVSSSPSSPSPETSAATVLHGRSTTQIQTELSIDQRLTRLQQRSSSMTDVTRLVKEGLQHKKKKELAQMRACFSSADNLLCSLRPDAQGKGLSKFLQKNLSEISSLGN